MCTKNFESINFFLLQSILVIEEIDHDANTIGDAGAEEKIKSAIEFDHRS